MKTTSKYGLKRYRCAHCGREHEVGTNHYGEVYSPCPNGFCLSRRPVINATYQPPKHVCLEKLPKGMFRPATRKVAVIKVESL